MRPALTISFVPVPTINVPPFAASITPFASLTRVISSSPRKPSPEMVLPTLVSVSSDAPPVMTFALVPVSSILPPPSKAAPPAPTINWVVWVVESSVIVPLLSTVPSKVRPKLSSTTTLPVLVIGAAGVEPSNVAPPPPPPISITPPLAVFSVPPVMVEPSLIATDACAPIAAITPVAVLFTVVGPSNKRPPVVELQQAGVARTSSNNHVAVRRGRIDDSVRLVDERRRDEAEPGDGVVDISQRVR